ncbi:hypothetical protein BAUCODRAFT_288309 [Baudoinia panamericana UAMH 10762]|uniref:DUF7053 domain-containing protein n=1 Tax=Baudoinia panamericana (strain UAMH 10762) TaxID=717646 RepID=M2LEJ6_BAUPA|nr:uncharacterized protein BAUCODRAFT_288309 [Baudoinia panamericana UAMH 10762]EMC92417.1 hypothetical protein BAUCODRAFT_288309 [Baudoinia panamericana UAMH 10762]
MFETNFSHASASPLPPNASIDLALELLHDFEFVIRLSPDCRGCKRIPPPTAKNGYPKTNATAPNGTTEDQTQYYEVEDDLPFMPKKFWSGGVKYTADFQPKEDGCDITVHAPGGFTSTNHWRILRETLHEEAMPTLERVKSKDLLHAETTGGGWYVQIISDARCNKTFVTIVKGFLKNSHAQLQAAFIEKLRAPPAQQRSRRPTLGRRKSSEF